MTYYLREKYVSKHLAHRKSVFLSRRSSGLSGSQSASGLMTQLQSEIT